MITLILFGVFVKISLPSKTGPNNFPLQHSLFMIFFGSVVDLYRSLIFRVRSWTRNSDMESLRDFDAELVNVWTLS
jgi:hypothetical protein